jgi:hypothetical protein
MSTKLGSMSVGSTVKLKLGGTARDFLVVHQGLPSSMYDSSCNGTWLLLKDIYTTRQWDSSNNDYKNSDIHSYLNGTFLNLFDNDIKNAIKQVKIPYQNGTGSGGSVASGANGLSCKIFLLSGYEVGFSTSDNSYFPRDGAKLSYFSSGSSSSANNKRIANYNGSATYWWLRSPYTGDTSYVWDVYSNGNYDVWFCSDADGVRPALVLDSSLSVSDDGSVQTNQPPTTPSSISVPENISGGSTITISWGASTDPDGNLEGYIVERSDNGGSSWSQIYQGNATSTQNSVAYGTQSVMYRVKAYDSNGEQSGYRTSSQVEVINNTAPSAPPSISVPTEVKGGSTLQITWSASSDTEGNVSGYVLERKVDDGEWTQVLKENALSFTDTITKGWGTVAYRVKAYDAYNAESAWTTSQTRTVNNNTAPTITCDYEDNQNLGTKTSGFTVSYSVNDEDAADSVTVTEKMDGVVKRTFTATKSQNNSFAVTGEYFMKLLNGNHTMVIEASDGKETTTLTLTFAKKAVKAVITLETPMDADAKISICAITVTGHIPTDADYTVEVTNNAKDDSPVWEDCTQECKNGNNYLFQNETAANGFAFNFRVTAERGDSDEGGYITSIQGGFQ